LEKVKNILLGWCESEQVGGLYPCDLITKANKQSWLFRGLQLPKGFAVDENNYVGNYQWRHNQQASQISYEFEHREGRTLVI
jgi:hypothetical protein